VTLTAGPLDRRTAELVKLGLAVGARQEGGVHSHVRRALEAGATPEEVRHAIRLAVTTVGFPTMMAALTWAEDLLGGRTGSGTRRRGPETPAAAAPAARSRAR
jgi:AhpD family alkylhydroperoxidase